MLSFLKRKDSQAPAGAVDEAASVQAARARARRRLVGAAVLIGIGIVAFPLLFETQPRPIAVDIPIVVPSRDQVPPLTPPARRAAASAPLPSVAAVAEPAAPAAASAAAAGEAERPASAPPARAASVPAAASAAAPVRSAAVAGALSPENKADAQRAQALLDGKPVASATAATPAAAPPASAAKAGRFVVQAGAYTDAATLREARQKVEKLGLKTYTQVIETDGGSRTRVRVGPFDTREDAEKAAARIKTSGLAASILSL